MKNHFFYPYVGNKREEVSSDGDRLLVPVIHVVDPPLRPLLPTMTKRNPK